MSVFYTGKNNFLVDHKHVDRDRDLSDPDEYVLFDPNLIDSSGVYLQPFVEILDSSGERMGIAKFINQRVYYPRKYENRLVFEVQLEHRDFYRKEWKDSSTSTRITKELNAWWSTLGISGLLKIVDYSSCRGIRFINVELIR